MCRVNYVVACWSGERRDKDLKYIKDSTYYLQKQLDCLLKYKHNLTQITFVIPENPSEKKEYKEFISHIPDKIQSANVVIKRRENKGLSYGSYSYAYELYKDTFDYYIFTEDDWVFVQNNFDLELIDLFNKDKCGYLCGLVLPYRNTIVTAVSNGITTKEILSIIWNKYGCIPYGEVKSKLKNNYSIDSQFYFSNSFLKFKISDITKKYSTPFNHVGQLRVFTQSNWNYKTKIPNDKPVLMMPIQFLHLLS